MDSGCPKISPKSSKRTSGRVQNEPRDSPGRPPGARQGSERSLRVARGSPIRENPSVFVTQGSRRQKVLGRSGEGEDFATSFDAEGSIARQVDVTRCVRQTRGKQRRQLSKDSRGQRSTLGSATMPFGESNMNSRKVRFGRRTIRARRIFCDQL